MNLKGGTQSNYNNAVLLVKMLSSLEQTRLEISPELFSDVHIQAGMNSIQNGLFDQGRERLMCAYNNLRAENTSESDYHIIALHKCSGDSKCVHRVQDLLKIYCNLKVTINDEDCLSGRSFLDYYKAMFNFCSTILVVFHGSDDALDDPGMVYARSAVELPDLRSKFIVLTDKDLATDISFVGLHKCSPPSPDDQDGIQWIKQFLSLVVKIGHIQPSKTEILYSRQRV